MDFRLDSTKNDALASLIGAPYKPQRESDFAAGDRVKVELDPDVWRLMQEGHGGWNDLMTVVNSSLVSHSDLQPQVAAMSGVFSIVHLCRNA